MRETQSMICVCKNTLSTGTCQLLALTAVECLRPKNAQKVSLPSRISVMGMIRSPHISIDAKGNLLISSVERRRKRHTTT